MNNNYYGRGYIPAYPQNYNQSNINEQNILDQIDNQINQLVGMKNQMRHNTSQQQPTAINQTFQISPNNNNGIKYVNSIEDVQKETIFFDTPFFSKDLSVVWLKSPQGDIKAYELNEIIEKDEKDLQIEFLQEQVNELKGKIKHEQSNTNVITEQDEPNASTIDESIGKSTKESKSTSISRVSTSKKKQ